MLKQGEPFTPVVLRVHSDPISIIGKVLEQNPRSYTRIQDVLEIGFNMVRAGLTVHAKHKQVAVAQEQEEDELSMTEKRVTAMCIDSALAEHDFETAYSYVVSRLAQIGQVTHPPSRPGSRTSPSASSAGVRKKVVDSWSWKAALNAGKYKRTSKSTRPTHLGTASGNPEIRHLEHRVECLSTALRIAPPSTLQQILNNFRQCEEELEAAIKVEEADEEAWNVAGDVRSRGRKRGEHMPGGFVPAPGSEVQRGSLSAARASEEAPLSLFDLARAVAPAAQRNLSALSSLRKFGSMQEGGYDGGQGGEGGAGTGTKSPAEATRAESGRFGGILGGHGDDDAGSSVGEEGEDERPRVRKRVQLRDAAMGTLVSGVGWLVGAPPMDRTYSSDKK